MASVIAAVRATDRAVGATESIVWSMCVMPCDGMSPCVAFSETTPQNAAGTRPEPP